VSIFRYYFCNLLYKQKIYIYFIINFLKKLNEQYRLTRSQVTEATQKVEYEARTEKESLEVFQRQTFKGLVQPSVRIEPSK